MEIKVPTYTDPLAFASALVKKYSFTEKSFWNSNLLFFPNHHATGTIQLFVHRDIHFYRAKWQFKQPSSFYCDNIMAHQKVIDFRVDMPGTINSAKIEGQKKFEWEITSVNGFRLFLPETYFSCPKNVLLRKVEKYSFHPNIQVLQREIIELSPQTASESMLLESRFLEFIHYLLDFLNQQDIDVHFQGLTPYQLNCIYDAKTILDSHLHATPTITELSKKVGLNTELLKRGFRLVLNLPIRQYLIKTKMERVRELILNTEKPIGEICEAFGYTNRGHFAQTYQKYYGCLPQQDRQKLE